MKNIKYKAPVITPHFKRVGKYVIKLTSKCFDKAINKVMRENGIEASSRLTLLQVVRFGNLYVHYALSDKKTNEELKEMVDDLYLNSLLKLSTKDITKILKIHDLKIVRRADRTVEALVSELTSRALLGDSKEPKKRKKRVKSK